MALPQPQPEAATKHLILDSLEVKNFRAFRHLQIPKLGRVNLITGKNNVGKSSLLEALWLYTRRGSLSVLRALLTSRDEFRPRVSTTSGAEDPSSSSEIVDELSEAYRIRTLFHGRPKIEEDIEPIEIGEARQADLAFRVYLHWLPSDFEGTSQPRRTDTMSEARIYVDLQDEHIAVYKLSDLASPIPPTRSSQRRLENIPSQYVRANGLGDAASATLWDQVALTDLEDEVISSLRLIAESVTRISLIGERFRLRERAPFVKMTNFDEPVPMRSLGDGINRLFGIVLALVNAKDGLLLIDEAENGLHYSVLPDVWRLIFQTARRLNVQVFATTHSWDCIEAFQKAADEDEQDEGVLVRLQNKDGDVTATMFDERRLAVVTREGIEVR